MHENRISMISKAQLLKLQSSQKCFRKSFREPSYRTYEGKAFCYAIRNSQTP